MVTHNPLEQARHVASVGMLKILALVLSFALTSCGKINPIEPCNSDDQCPADRNRCVGAGTPSAICVAQDPCGSGIFTAQPSEGENQLREVPQFIPDTELASRLTWNETPTPTGTVQQPITERADFLIRALYQPDAADLQFESVAEGQRILTNFLLMRGQRSLAEEEDDDAAVVEHPRRMLEIDFYNDYEDASLPFMETRFLISGANPPPCAVVLELKVGKVARASADDIHFGRFCLGANGVYFSPAVGQISGENLLTNAVDYSTFQTFFIKYKKPILDEGQDGQGGALGEEENTRYTFQICRAPLPDEDSEDCSPEITAEADRTADNAGASFAGMVTADPLFGAGPDDLIRFGTEESNTEILWDYVRWGCRIDGGACLPSQGHLNDDPEFCVEGRTPNKPGEDPCGRQTAGRPGHAPHDEYCDGEDNDCDGRIDENFERGYRAKGRDIALDPLPFYSEFHSLNFAQWFGEQEQLRNERAADQRNLFLNEPCRMGVCDNSTVICNPFRSAAAQAGSVVPSNAQRPYHPLLCNDNRLVFEAEPRLLPSELCYPITDDRPQPCSTDADCAANWGTCFIPPSAENANSADTPQGVCHYDEDCDGLFDEDWYDPTSEVFRAPGAFRRDLEPPTVSDANPCPGCFKRNYSEREVNGVREVVPLENPVPASLGEVCGFGECGGRVVLCRPPLDGVNMPSGSQSDWVGCGELGEDSALLRENDAFENPVSEICGDRKDNDCDGRIDEVWTVRFNQNRMPNDGWTLPDDDRDGALQCDHCLRYQVFLIELKKLGINETQFLGANPALVSVRDAFIDLIGVPPGFDLRDCQADPLPKRPEFQEQRESCIEDSDCQDDGKDQYTCVETYCHGVSYDCIDDSFMVLNSLSIPGSEDALGQTAYLPEQINVDATEDCSGFDNTCETHLIRALNPTFALQLKTTEAIANGCTAKCETMGPQACSLDPLVPELHPGRTVSFLCANLTNQRTAVGVLYDDENACLAANTPLNRVAECVQNAEGQFVCSQECAGDFRRLVDGSNSCECEIQTPLYSDADEAALGNRLTSWLQSCRARVTDQGDNPACGDPCDGVDNDCDGAIDEGMIQGRRELGILRPSVPREENGIPKFARGQPIDGRSAALVPVDGTSDPECYDADPATGANCSEERVGEDETIYDSCIVEGAQGICRFGVFVCADDSQPPFDDALNRNCVSKILPGTKTEICDGWDNDCDGFVDEGYIAPDQGRGDIPRPSVANPSGLEDDGAILPAALGTDGNAAYAAAIMEACGDADNRSPWETGLICKSPCGSDPTCQANFAPQLCHSAGENSEACNASASNRTYLCATGTPGLCAPGLEVCKPRLPVVNFGAGDIIVSREEAACTRDSDCDDYEDPQSPDEDWVCNIYNRNPNQEGFQPICMLKYRDAEDPEALVCTSLISVANSPDEICDGPGTADNLKNGHRFDQNCDGHIDDGFIPDGEDGNRNRTYRRETHCGGCGNDGLTSQGLAVNAGAADPNDCRAVSNSANSTTLCVEGDDGYACSQECQTGFQNIDRSHPDCECQNMVTFFTQAGLGDEPSLIATCDDGIANTEACFDSALPCDSNNPCPLDQRCSQDGFCEISCGHGSEMCACGEKQNQNLQPLRCGEICNGIDDDCDGDADEAKSLLTAKCYPGVGDEINGFQYQGRDVVFDGESACTLGRRACIGTGNPGLAEGCTGEACFKTIVEVNNVRQPGDWCVGAILPVNEICDGKDNDCDGFVDESAAASDAPEGPPLTALEHFLPPEAGGLSRIDRAGADDQLGSGGTLSVGATRVALSDYACIPEAVENQTKGFCVSDENGQNHQCTTECIFGYRDNPQLAGSDCGCQVATPAYDAADCNLDGSFGDAVPADALNDVCDVLIGCQAQVDGDAPNASREENPLCGDPCNGLDDDCDGAIDEGFIGGRLDVNTGEIRPRGRVGAFTFNANVEPTEDPQGTGPFVPSVADWTTCETGLQGECSEGVWVCLPDQAAQDADRPNLRRANRANLNGLLGQSCVPINTPVFEVCDGVDNDCDGHIDEGYLDADSRLPRAVAQGAPPDTEEEIEGFAASALEACRDGFSSDGCQNLVPDPRAQGDNAWFHHPCRSVGDDGEACLAALIDLDVICRPTHPDVSIEGLCAIGVKRCYQANNVPSFLEDVAVDDFGLRCTPMVDPRPNGEPRAAEKEICSGPAAGSVNASTNRWFDEDCNGLVDDGFVRESDGKFIRPENCGACGDALIPLADDAAACDPNAVISDCAAGLYCRLQVDGSGRCATPNPANCIDFGRAMNFEPVCGVTEADEVQCAPNAECTSTFTNADGNVANGCECEDDIKIFSVECNNEATDNCTSRVKTCDDGVNNAISDGNLRCTETCDARDNDCDGNVDEAAGLLTATCIERTDALDGTDIWAGMLRAWDESDTRLPQGVCQLGRVKCSDGNLDASLNAVSHNGAILEPNEAGDPDWCQGQVLPSEEVCDGLDNDCDGTTDEGFYDASGTFVTGLHSQDLPASYAEAVAASHTCNIGNTQGDCELGIFQCLPDQPGEVAIVAKGRTCVPILAVQAERCGPRPLDSLPADFPYLVGANAGPWPDIPFTDDEDCDSNADEAEGANAFCVDRGAIAEGGAICQNGTCAIDAGGCIDNSFDSDGDPSNGCETNCEREQGFNDLGDFCSVDMYTANANNRCECRGEFACEEVTAGANPEVRVSCRVTLTDQREIFSFNVQGGQEADPALVALCADRDRINEQAETCDLDDNDCDGSIDETFDLAVGTPTDDVTTIEHCGACDRSCVTPQANAACINSQCFIQETVPGTPDCLAGRAHCDAEEKTACRVCADGEADCVDVPCELNAAPICDANSECVACDANNACPEATPVCYDGVCRADHTPPASVANGCEVDATTLVDCGGCGIVCNPDAGDGINYADACTNGACTCGGAAACDTNLVAGDVAASAGAKIRCLADATGTFGCRECENDAHCPGARPHCVTDARAGDAQFTCHQCDIFDNSGNSNGCSILNGAGPELSVNEQICTDVAAIGETPSYECRSCTDPLQNGAGNALCAQYYPDTNANCVQDLGCVKCVPTLGDPQNQNGRSGDALPQTGCEDAGSSQYCNLVSNNLHTAPVAADPDLTTAVVSGNFVLACGGCKQNEDCGINLVTGLQQPCNDPEGEGGGTCGVCNPEDHSGCLPTKPICLADGTCDVCDETQNGADGINPACNVRDASAPFCVDGTCKACNPLIDAANPHQHCANEELCCGFKCVPIGFTVVLDNGLERLNSETVDGVEIANYNRCLDCNVGCGVDLDAQGFITGKAADSCRDPALADHGEAGECRCGAAAACEGDTPYCNAQTCVECVSDEHCAANNDGEAQCVNLTCKQCDRADNNDDGTNPTCAAIDANASYCVDGGCAACDPNPDGGDSNGCAVLEQPICDSVTATCRACAANNECANGHCIDNGRCDDCASETDCTNHADGNVCSDAGRCTNCGNDDNQCFDANGNNAFGNRCVENRCAQCVSHADCVGHPLGNLCSNGVCAPCADDAGCVAANHPSGSKCITNVDGQPDQCGACVPAENTPNGNALCPNRQNCSALNVCAACSEDDNAHGDTDIANRTCADAGNNANVNGVLAGTCIGTECYECSAAKNSPTGNGLCADGGTCINGACAVCDTAGNASDGTNAQCGGGSCLLGENGGANVCGNCFQNDAYNDARCAAGVCMPATPENANTGVCRDCRDDADCNARSAGSLCQANGQCGQCAADADCNGHPNGNLCDGVACAFCQTNADCTASPFGNVCAGPDGAKICTQCEADVDCGGNINNADRGLYCNTSGAINVCDVCVDRAGAAANAITCDADSATPACVDNVCVPCSNDADCSDSGLGGQCVSSNGVFSCMVCDPNVEDLANNGCLGGLHCLSDPNEATRGIQCVGCLNDAHCDNGQTCDPANFACEICDTLLNDARGNGPAVVDNGCSEARPVCVGEVRCVGCTDATHCNTNEVCDDSVCKCGDTDACKTGETCNAATGACACGAGAACNPGETCDNGACACGDGAACDDAAPVCDNGACRACVVDTDCAGNARGNFCLNGSCVECDPNTDSGCIAGGALAECVAGTCSACDPNQTPTGCAVDGATPACAANATCVGCQDNADCPDADRPFCDSNTGSCHECLAAGGESNGCDPLSATPYCPTTVCRGCDTAGGADEDDGCNAYPTRSQCVGTRCEACDPADNEGCPAQLPICDAGTSVCRACAADDECGADLCVEGRCRACNPATNAGCTDPANNPFCSTATFTCGACTEDSHCTTHGQNATQCVNDACVLCDSADGAGCNAGSPVCSNGACIGCDDSQDCVGNVNATGNACVANACVACNGDADCNDHHLGNVCNNGVCGPCEGDGNCLGHTDGNVCLTAQNPDVCGACAANADCANHPTGTQCVNNSCAECNPLDNAGCDAAAPICDAATSSCRACNADNECAGALVCAQGQCRECDPADGNGCTDPANNPYCSPATFTCGDCTEDSDCAPHGNNLSQCVGGACTLCDAVDGAGCTAAAPVCNANACQACNASTDCVGNVNATGNTCTNGACVPCASDAECVGHHLGNVCTNGACGPCSDDNACLDHPTGNQCNTAADPSVCATCGGNNDCIGHPAGDICTNNACSPCVTSDDCTNTPDGEVCISGQCVNCESNAQCSGHPSGSICQNPGANTGDCVGCADNAACAAAYPGDATQDTCTNIGGVNSCVECSFDAATQTTAGCDAGKVCQVDGNDRACVTCFVDAGATDIGCTAEQPACLNGAACVECTADGNCANGQVCNTSTNRCVDCVGDGNCAGATPACDTISGTCVQCTAANVGQCNDPTDVCHTTQLRCVECNADGDCAAGQACDTASSRCVECVDDGDCAGNANGTTCKAATNTCGCADDAACPVAAPACDTNGSQTCVACTDNTDCAGDTPVCNLATNQCTACVANSDCAFGQICSGNACVGCEVDGDCANATGGQCVGATAGNADGACLECDPSGVNNDGCDDNARPYCVAGICRAECLIAGDLGCAPGSNLTQCVEVAGVNECVACDANSQCSGATPTCSNTNQCVACTVDGDCANSASGGTVCVTAGANAGQCLGCDDSTDCSGTTPVCDANNACVACTDNNQCTGNEPVCDIASGDCGCGNDADCGANEFGSTCLVVPGGQCGCGADTDCPVATKPICNAGSKQCEACVDDAGCNGNANGNLCAPAGGAGVAGACGCLANEDCGVGTCDSGEGGTFVCVP